MKKISILIICLFSVVSLFAQKNSYHVEYYLSSLQYKKDLLTPGKDKILKVDFESISEIIPLGETKKNKYGIQFEIMETHLDNKTVYYIAVAYYTKVGNKWESILSTEPAHISFSAGKLNMDDDRLSSYSSDELKIKYSLVVSQKE